MHDARVAPGWGVFSAMDTLIVHLRSHPDELTAESVSAWSTSWLQSVIHGRDVTGWTPIRKGTWVCTWRIWKSDDVPKGRWMHPYQPTLRVVLMASSADDATGVGAWHAWAGSTPRVWRPDVMVHVTPYGGPFRQAEWVRDLSTAWTDVLVLARGHPLGLCSGVRTPRVRVSAPWACAWPSNHNGYWRGTQWANGEMRVLTRVTPPDAHVREAWAHNARTRADAWPRITDLVQQLAQVKTYATEASLTGPQADGTKPTAADRRRWVASLASIQDVEEGTWSIPQAADACGFGHQAVQAVRQTCVYFDREGLVIMMSQRGGHTATLQTLFDALRPGWAHVADVPKVGIATYADAHQSTWGKPPPDLAAKRRRAMTYAYDPNMLTPVTPDPGADHDTYGGVCKATLPIDRPRHVMAARSLHALETRLRAGRGEGLLSVMLCRNPWARAVSVWTWWAEAIGEYDVSFNAFAAACARVGPLVVCAPGAFRDRVRAAIPPQFFQLHARPQCVCPFPWDVAVPVEHPDGAIGALRSHTGRMDLSVPVKKTLGGHHAARKDVTASIFPKHPAECTLREIRSALGGGRTMPTEYRLWFEDVDQGHGPGHAARAHVARLYPDDVALLPYRIDVGPW
jgi:hypothetical protein